MVYRLEQSIQKRCSFRDHIWIWMEIEECFFFNLKRVEEKRSNARVAEHFISFSQRVK